MCASCGCGKPNESHGDHRHITYEQIQQSARAANITPMQAAQNMLDSTRQMIASQGSQAGRSTRPDQSATDMS